MPSNVFPVERIPEIQTYPRDFRLLQRVPLTIEGATLPYSINPPVGDEKMIVVADVETTGLDANNDRIIEIGIVRASYSPSAKRMTAILEAHSQHEDPGVPIPEFISRLTGITDADVAGKHIDDAWVGMQVSDDPILLAHNAAFDRAFLDSRFPAFERQRWGCTASEIPWGDLGFEGKKLEYLLLKLGYFYEGHRAEVDCLATAWLLAERPDAFSMLLDSIEQQTVVVRAFGAPFGVKDQLKERGYRWHPGDSGSNKCWWCEVAESDLSAEREFLDETYHDGSVKASYEPRDSRARYRNPVE